MADLFNLIVNKSDENEKIAVQPSTIYYFKKNYDDMNSLPPMNKGDKYFHSLSFVFYKKL